MPIQMPPAVTYVRTCVPHLCVQLETLKYAVDRTATDLEGMRAQCAVLSRQVKDQTQRLETYQIQRRTLQGELQKKMQQSLTAEERAQEMDEVLSIEEANIKRLEREMEKSREKQVCVCACVRACVRVCVCLHMYVCMCEQKLRATYIHTYVHVQYT